MNKLTDSGNRLIFSQYKTKFNNVPKTRPVVITYTSILIGVYIIPVHNYNRTLFMITRKRTSYIPLLSESVQNYYSNPVNIILNLKGYRNL